MSRADYLAKSREAGIYMQTFICARQEDFSEAARESSPHKGWNGLGVDEAHVISRCPYGTTRMSAFCTAVFPRTMARP